MGRDLRAKILKLINDDLIQDLQLRQMDEDFRREIKRLADLSARINDLVKDMNLSSDKENNNPRS